MALTHFPYGVFTPLLVGPNASVVVPTGSFPSAANQMQGYQGVQFVSADKGNDSYNGLTPSRPLKNLDTAFSRCAGGQNEIIYVLGGTAAVSFSTGNSWSPTSGSTGLAWNLNYTHLIGLAAPVWIGERARITGGASTNLFTPLITVSGNGCLFQNVEIANVGSDATAAAVAVAVTGVRNAFINCQIAGGFNSTSAGNAAMRSLLLGGTVGGTGTAAADENYFQHCYIGLDTIARSAANSEVEILNGSARVSFEDCMFSTYSSAGSNFFVTIGASGIDRFALFKRCQFMNAGTLSGGVALSDAFSFSGTPGGQILFTDCLITGSTATSATKTAEYGDNAYAAATTAKAVNLSW